MAVVSKNTISSLVKGLEADGYLRRELSPADKRVFRIHLTASGRELVSLCSPRRLERLNDLITDLAPTEQATLVDLLSRLVRSFSHNAGSKSQVDMSGMSVSGRGVSVSQPSPD
jgi:DNA-binding MarR family transcriptional regulator